MDALYAAAADATLGVRVSCDRTTFALWAPTARGVALCLHDTGEWTARTLAADAARCQTGVWSTTMGRDLSGQYYTFLVDVHVDGVGLVRNRVTDPYAVSLTTDSRRGYVANLQSPQLKPPGWDATPAPDRLQAQTDAMIYELHVRDFSIGDPSVRRELPRQVPGIHRRTTRTACAT